MEIEKKNKVKKVCLITYLVVSTILSLILIICCCVAIPNIKKSDGLALSDNEVSYNINRENKKLVSFDDSDYSINFVKADLVNDRWENLFNYFDDYGFTENEGDNSFSMNLSSGYIEDKKIIYTDYTYSVENVNYQVIISDTIEHYADWWLGMGYEGTPTFSPYKFYLVHEGQIEEWDNNELLSIVADDTGDYPDLVSAVELDIQANVNQGNINDSIFGTLTTSVVAFIGSLSNGIVAMTSVFYTNNALTVIGLLSVIVVAVALAYWLFRLIIGLIRMRG